MDVKKLQTPEEMMDRWQSIVCQCDPDVGYLCEGCHDLQVIRELVKQRDALKATDVCRGDWLLGSACGCCYRCVVGLLKVIDQLRDEDACEYDRHELCQSHNLHKRPCPHQIANEIIADWKTRQF